MESSRQRQRGLSQSQSQSTPGEQPCSLRWQERVPGAWVRWGRLAALLRMALGIGDRGGGFGGGAYLLSSTASVICQPTEAALVIIAAKREPSPAIGWKALVASFPFPEPDGITMVPQTLAFRAREWRYCDREVSQASGGVPAND